MTDHTMFHEVRAHLLMNGFQRVKKSGKGDHHKFKKASRTITVPVKMCDPNLKKRILKQAGIVPAVR